MMIRMTGHCGMHNVSNHNCNCNSTICNVNHYHNNNSGNGYSVYIYKHDENGHHASPSIVTSSVRSNDDPLIHSSRTQSSSSICVMTDPFMNDKTRLIA